MKASRAKRQHRSARARSAFTLLELMVSLTVGGIAITSIYAVGAASARTFHQQLQIANTQGALRLAMNQLKRDIARAGYLATPWAGATGQGCGTPDGAFENASGKLAAFSRFTNNVARTAGINDAVDPTQRNAANGFTVDDLVMFGNYETGAEYPGVMHATSTQITVSQRWQSFQHDFTNWYSSTPTGFDAAAFNDAFTVNRLIRIQTAKGLRHFARVTQVIAPTVSDPNAAVGIVFTPAIPDACLNDVDNGWVAPVSTLRYSVRNAVGSTDVAQLLRENVLPGDKTTLLSASPAMRRAILDYVVGFNLRFTLNGDNAIGNADNYVPGASTEDDTTVNNNPQYIRSVTIDLAVRAPLPDPKLGWSAAACANMRCFQVSDTPGAARVRRLRSEVFVPNVAFEGY